MLLITETSQEGMKTIKETNHDGSPEYYIQGIFMQADKQNKNGRIYPKEILMKEAKRYDEEYVQKKRALGELGHPEGPTINLDRVCHNITELWNEGSDVYGKAKILDTPMGNIVKNLLDGGCELGVSTRGMGSLKSRKGINEVQDDFSLAAVDCVADPSAPDAYVQGIMEGKEWVWDNGILKCREIESHKELIERAHTREDRESAILHAFRGLMKG